jgi:hypothetical protein
MEILRGRALKILNIFKTFSHRSWQLDSYTLKCIYDALIGSYYFFAIKDRLTDLGKR